MLWSYVKIAFRSLKKYRLVSFINVFGLGLSMSVGMMEMLIVQHELSYDRFHPHPERTFRIVSSYTPKNGMSWKMASTPLPLYSALLRDSETVQDAVNIYPALHGNAATDAKKLSLDGAFTEPSFFNVFGFSLSAGNEATALQKPNSLIITPATASRFFGDANPLGKSINMGPQGLFQVTGVLNPAPGKSHIDFDAYASASSIPLLELNKLLPSKSNDWSDFRTAYTYVLLKKESGEKPLQGILNSVVARMNAEDKNGRTSMSVQPIEKIRPASGDLNNDTGGGTTWTKLWVGINVSLIILLAACFNYTNLTVARALTRAKEVGIRKISGAKRYQIFTQYVVESVMLSFLALAFAWILLSVIVRYAPFNDSYEMIPSSWHYNATYLFLSFGFALLTGLLAGIAPAWILSAFKPLRVLKNLSTAKIFGKISLQKTLIVFQYSLSLVIIIFLFTFYRQFSLLGSEDPGFQRDHVLVVPLNGLQEPIVAQKIGMLSGVKSVSALSRPFEGHFYGLRSEAWVGDGKENKQTINYYFADPAFIPSMHLDLLAGRNFSPRADASGEADIVLNERAVKSFGIRSNSQAIGKKVWINDSVVLTVIGVVKDFKYENAGKPVYPMAFRSQTAALNYLFIAVDPTEKDVIAGRIERAW
ncbi:MAG TPA: ABC transporter permease, partial [Puia sp.]|nr:ABC transporter permease [Puia sp.]